MAERDPWKVFDELSDEEKERVLKAVSTQRNGTRSQMSHMSDREVTQLAELLAELEADRKRRKLGEILERFLP